MYPLPTACTPHSQAPCRNALYIHFFLFLSFLFIHHFILFTPSSNCAPSVLETLDSCTTTSPVSLVLDLLPQLKSSPYILMQSAIPKVSLGAFQTSLPKSPSGITSSKISLTNLVFFLYSQI